MDSQGDWLARLLANLNLTKTMDKENGGSAQNAASNMPQIITWLYWNGQLLEGYVTTQVAHFSTTHNRYTQEGWETSSISMNVRNVKASDQMKTLVAADILCAYYPDPFYISTDASDY